MARVAMGGGWTTLRELRRLGFKLGPDLRLRSGLPFLQGEACLAMAREATERGFSIAIHALGNAAVEDALDLFEQIRPHHPDDPPPRIEHALLISDDQLRRAADLGVVLGASVNFGF